MAGRILPYHHRWSSQTLAFDLNRTLDLEPPRDLEGVAVVAVAAGFAFDAVRAAFGREIQALKYSAGPYDESIHV